jgi:hypothetical protein
MGVPCSLERCACPRFPLGVPGEPLELVLTAGVAEHDFVSGSHKDRAELSAHQT